MKNKKAILAMWALALLPFLLVALTWKHLPRQVPIHWGLSGQIDGYASPAALWALAAVNPILAVLIQFLPHLDPKRENYGKFQGLYDLFGVLLPVIGLAAMGVTLSEALRPGMLPVGRIVSLMVGVLFLIVGNLMGKVKPNWFMGVRTPWALSDPDVWNRTQRLGGWVFFLSGLAMILLSFLAPEWMTMTVFFLLLLGGLVLTYFMSWKWYREKRS